MVALISAIAITMSLICPFLKVLGGLFVSGQCIQVRSIVIDHQGVPR